MRKYVVGLVSLLVATAPTAWAQLINIKTVPVAQADQFAIFPSRNLGMGGVAIALADPKLDPFQNPAKGARLTTPYLFGSPGLYTVSSDAGGGRTLPLAAALRTGSWFGGLAFALQQVDASQPPFNPPIILVADGSRPADIVPPPPPGSLGARTHGNELAFAMLGRTLPEARLSIGASAFWAGLSAIDGVDMMYAGSQGIRQTGHAMDLRLGLLKEWVGDRSLEALVLYDRLRMTHDVTYLDLIWDPGTQRILQKPRPEQNRDWTDVWGLHLEYERPLPGPGWRIGWLATVNRMSHPKLPEYQIVSVQAIPRDPGTSYAFNVGLGLSRTYGPAIFGLDVIYEPIWSNTWADAAEPVPTARGDTIPVGGRTVDNYFRFSNALFRMGVSRDLGRTVDLQLGLMARAIQYWLTQDNNVQATRRHHEEQWLEWAPTWGFGLRFPELEIRYQGSVVNGTGRPGVVPQARGGLELASVSVPNNIIVAPSGPLSLGEVKVTTHRVGLSIPLR